MNSVLSLAWQRTHGWQIHTQFSRSREKCAAVDRKLDVPYGMFVFHNLSPTHKQTQTHPTHTFCASLKKLKTLHSFLSACRVNTKQLYKNKAKSEPLYTAAFFSLCVSDRSVCTCRCFLWWNVPPSGLQISHSKEDRVSICTDVWDQDTRAGKRTRNKRKTPCFAYHVAVADGTVLTFSAK